MRPKGIDRKTRRREAKMGANGGELQPFIAIDGEGITRADGVHLYTLLAASDESFIANDEGLDSRECLDYLLGLKTRHPNAIFVSFYFRYDVNMILFNVDRRAVKILAETDSCHMVDSENPQFAWRISYIPGKIFTVSRYVKAVKNEGGEWVKCRDKTKNLSITIYDVFGFFQGSFVDSLSKMGVGSDEQIAVLQRMKAARQDFDVSDNDDVFAYNQMECDLLVRMMDKLRDAMITAGIHLSRWYGAGAVASELNTMHGVKTHISRPDTGDPELDKGIVNAYMGAYFGGRIQAVRIGIFEGETGVVGHDLVSAYPSTIRNLPSLTGGVWDEIEEFIPLSDDGEWCLYFVHWNCDERRIIQPFPHRKNNGGVEYPFAGIGWYWAYEVASALRHFGGAISIIRGYRFTPKSGVKPFGFVDQMYEARKRFKAEGNHAQLALKLGLNSLYGKTAQGVSGKGKRPACQSYIWAGLITSHTRARMLDLAMRGENDVIAFATDGLFARRDLLRQEEVEEGEVLGGWETENYDKFFIVKSGIYAGWKLGVRRTWKIRGFRTSDVDFDAVEKVWRRLGIYGVLKRKSRRFVTMKSAGDLIQSERWLKWETYHRAMSLYPTRGMAVPGGVGFGADVVTLMPVSYAGVESVGYEQVEYTEDDKNNEGMVGVDYG